MGYESWFIKWLDGIESELTFWNDFMLNRGGEFFYGYRNQVDPKRPFTLENDIPANLYGKELKFLDVGSGPFGRCGRISKKVSLYITTVDPLAYGYRILKNNYQADNGADLRTGFVEFLDKEFDENSFDMVHMSNSLDHSFDPMTGILQLLWVCKIGGKVILRHHPNEAVTENYQGFHQWNLCIEEGHFIIWRSDERIDVSERVRDLADIELIPDQHEGSFIYDKVVLRKKNVVELPENSYYEKAMRMIYERLLTILLQGLETHDFRGSKRGKTILLLSDVFDNAIRFKGIWEKYKKYNKVSVYGMGAIGRDLVQIFLHYRIHVKDMIDKNGGSYNGQTIINIGDYHQDNDEILIVASVYCENEMLNEARKDNKTINVVSVGDLLMEDPFLVKKEMGDCTGCEACVNECPTGAISMKEGKDFFLIPEVDKNRCIGCKKCERICSRINKPSGLRIPKKCFAVMADDIIRKGSSSGGAFPVIADYFLENGGYICGTVYSGSSSVQYLMGDSFSDLEKMRTSKYVQARKFDIYRKVRDQLQNNSERKVLFAGLPCEVYALKTFLNMSYQNLFCVDILCHGVPSEHDFKDYIEDEGKGKIIKTINFRDKRDGWGYSLLLLLLFEDGQRRYRKDKDSSYYDLFLKRTNLRDCCSRCQYARQERAGDISIGDYWGIQSIEKSMDDGFGTSLLLVNTEKGQAIFDEIKDKFSRIKELPFESAQRGNMVLVHPIPAHPRRKEYFALRNSKGIKETAEYILGGRYES